MYESATLARTAPRSPFPFEPEAGREVGGKRGSSRPRRPVPGASPQDGSVQALLTEYARTRDPRLRDRLVFRHDRMVRYLAARFGLGAGTTLDDLIQVGYIGLLSAIDRYDPARGVSFATYAVPTILGELKRYFRDQTWGLKAPRRLRELGLSLRRMREEMEQALGRPPTVQEMAAAAKVPEDRLLQAMDLDRVYQPASLDVPAAEESDDRVSPWDAVGELDPQIARIEEREALARALDRLDGRQRNILQLRFFEEMSQAQVAREMGISQMHVSRLERQALQRLRIMLGG